MIQMAANANQSFTNGLDMSILDCRIDDSYVLSDLDTLRGHYNDQNRPTTNHIEVMPPIQQEYLQQMIRQQSRNPPAATEPRIIPPSNNDEFNIPNPNYNLPCNNINTFQNPLDNYGNQQTRYGNNTYNNTYNNNNNQIDRQQYVCNNNNWNMNIHSEGTNGILMNNSTTTVTFFDQQQVADRMGDTVLSEYVSEYAHGSPSKLQAFNLQTQLLRTKSNPQQQQQQLQQQKQMQCNKQSQLDTLPQQQQQENERAAGRGNQEVITAPTSNKLSTMNEKSVSAEPKQFGAGPNETSTSTIINASQEGKTNNKFPHQAINQMDKLIVSIAKNQELKKPICLNVMVAGAQGLGKSTFIDAFLNRKFTKEAPEIIRAKTLDIIEHKGTRSEGLVNLHLNMIDTPGYDPSQNFTEWIGKLTSFIESKFQAYEEYEGKQIEERILVSPDSPNQDERVNVCLYFMSGSRLKKQDIMAMKELKDIVNLIPILAKGDCLTIDEIKETKRLMQQDAQENNIEFFNCENPLIDEPERLNQLLNGPLGQAPPFLIISSVTPISVSDNKYEYVRQYPWGTCKIENPEHSDFMLLYQLLISYFVDDLKKFTEYYYKKYGQKQKQLQQQQQQSRNDEKSAQNLAQKSDFFKGGLLAAAGILAFGLLSFKNK